MTLKGNFIILLLVMLFITPFFIRAQTSNDVSLEATPREPGAYEIVKMRLLSYGVDLGRSEILWYVNDVLGNSGVGITTFQFTTKALGTQTKVDVVVKTPTGSKFSRSTTFRPTDVDIVWSAHTYTPPFYKGKRLASSKSLLRLNAISRFIDSRGKEIAPHKLLYTWEQDGVVLGAISGVGKDSVVLQALPVSSSKTYVTVTISSFDSALRAQKTVAVRTVGPSLFFYEKHPLQGVRYERALAEFEPKEEEFVVRAEPYFFSLDDLQNKQLEYRWSVNDEEVHTAENNLRELTLRRETETPGIARVKLKIENASRLLQLVENILYVNL